MTKTIMLTFATEQDFEYFMEYKNRADKNEGTVTGLTNGLMTSAIRDANIMQEPKAKFKIGQTVFYTNSNGVKIGKKKVIGISKDLRYYLEPTDTPWFCFPEDELRAA